MKNLFYKYDCAGNILVLVKYEDNISYPDFSKKICSKENGVSADGLIVIKEDLNELIYYNSDGSTANFCGNATRAYLQYMDEHNGLINNKINFIFNNTIYQGKIVSKNPFISKITIDKNKDVQLRIKSKFNDFKEEITLPNITYINDKKLKLYPIKIGVFHMVILNDTNNFNNDFLNEEELIILKEDLKKYYLEEPNIEIFNLATKEITFYEKGVGYTKSCGSGSLSLFIILELLGYLKTNYLKINDDLMVVSKDDKIELIGKSKLLCWGKYLC
jgi:diaminopimelate epimerase